MNARTALVFCLTISGVAAGGTITSTIGTLSSANDQYGLTFEYDPATDGGLLEIQTWGYGGTANAPGGSTAMSWVLPGGGFNPQLWLFSGLGQTSQLIAFNDDGDCPVGTLAPNCMDAHLALTGQSAGSFTLILTVFGNDFLGGIGDPLSTGFSNLGDLGDRTKLFAVDVISSDPLTVNPEPMSLVLAGIGLVGIWAVSRRKQNR